MIKFYIDLDGVCQNFVKGSYLAHNKDYSIEIENKEVKHFDWWIDKWGMSNKEFWKAIDDLGPDFWSNLELYEWFDDLITMCPNFAIATSPAHHSNSTSGKIEALQEIFGYRFRSYHITPEKWDLGAPGRVLIDDLETNCEKFEANGGSSILMPQPWNANAHLINERMEFVKSEIEKLKLIEVA